MDNDNCGPCEQPETYNCKIPLSSEPLVMEIGGIYLEASN
jgi:hypothetical protein